ncbi:MAG: hypothetical protein DMG06_10010 [Acidobacteria bacterium]|nr:MAG: hypothetical protein DMG06_10010 [Acidobacteriota bacterium]
MKVLLIHHHPSTRTLLEELSETFNYVLHCDSDPLNAQIAYASQSFDVMIVETTAGEYAWFSLIEDLQKSVPTPFLIIIGKGSEEEMTGALNLRAETFLVEPLQPKLLLMAFRQMMKRMELESQVQEAQRQAARIQQELAESLERQQEAITEKDLTYRELLLAYSRLQELNQQKNNFLAMVTHELRTPVTIMKGYHRILLDERLGKLQPQQQEVLLESEQSCTRLIRIINSLLDLSRIETGKLELLYQENDFVDNVKMIIEQNKEACKRKQLSLVLKLDKGIRRFRYDRDKVNQVLTHLLENSVKYTPPGGKVYVSVEPYFWKRRNAETVADHKGQEKERRKPEEGINHSSNAIMVQVTDTGIGISPEHQREIFDEFTQVSSNQMNRSGLGLGLAISKRIVEAHGGKIWVDSQLNSGSKFIFLLPLNPIQVSSGVNEVNEMDSIINKNQDGAAENYE